MPNREKRLTDLERRAYRHMVAVHAARTPDKALDSPYLSLMARAAVEALTIGSASGRRVRAAEERAPDPGSTPERVRSLARSIEDSFHTMPNGWVRAEESRTRHE